MTNRERRRVGIGARLLTWFLRGLVYLVPIVLTVFVFWTTFRALDGLLGRALGISVPGVGVALAVVLTTLLGALLSNFLSARLFGAFEAVLDRLPFARLLHTSAKDLMGAFVGEKRRFDAAVAVEIVPGTGVRALGFVTRSSLTSLGLGEGQVAVYFPQAYNWGGQVLLVPSARVEPLTADAGEMMAFIVSGGVAGHPGATERV
jgi:uncharacterized membrane protein